MVLDDHDPADPADPDGGDGGDNVDEAVDEAGEWLDGLRTAGLPVTVAPERQPSEPVRALVAASCAPATLRAYETS